MSWNRKLVMWVLIVAASGGLTQGALRAAAGRFQPSAEVSRLT